MKKLNCWEVKKCGCSDNEKAANGICPTMLEAKLHGVHGGSRAGRACWVVAGTFCGGAEQGTFAKKYHNCLKCDFYNRVRQEEGPDFEDAISTLARLKRAEIASYSDR